jgi:L-alanine-DL-glutamate epimerase-like enolase superfamily enzyme|tara:strand:+ start:2273 stop:3400 length:1128 start_codon:yes stop_codon:yes gene_type:complete
MKITDIKINLMEGPKTEDAKQFVGGASKVLLRIETDEGIFGIAEGGRNYNLFKAYLEETINPLLIGIDPRNPKMIWEMLTHGTGPGLATKLPSQIVGTIDVALWDLSGKAAGLPVYQLLGGAARTEIPLYWSRGSGWRKTPDEMLSDVKLGYEKGYKAYKIRMDWRSFRQDSNPKKDFSLFEKCREFLPDDCDLSFDANCGYSVPTAIEQGKKFQDLGIAHFEEPLPEYDYPGLRQVVDALECSVSTGEQEPNPYRFRDLVDIGNPDILQPDILNVGGITGLIKVYELAMNKNKIIMPHCPQAGVNLIGSLHAYSTVTNAIRPHEFSEEFTGPVENIAKLFKEPIVPNNGSITLSDRPGLGLEYDEKELKKVIAI